MILTYRYSEFNELSTFKHDLPLLGIYYKPTLKLK